jgi:GTP-binding protein
VGRPNVGKSSLFNALYGRRVAIVEPTAGVTRDRITRLCEHDGTRFELVDTGGMGTEQELSEHVEDQIRIALDRADLVLLVVEGPEGVQPLDHRIAHELRRAGKEVLVVVNKCDRMAQETAAADFYSLGFGELHPVSAIHRRGTGKLLDRMAELLPRTAGPEEAEPMKLAFVGRRNVGKSTLVNYLAREPRVVVSETPGTTRDSVDVRFRIDDMQFVAIDTAGVRHRKQIKTPVDYYSTARSFRAIERADVAVLMIEAPTEIARIDKKLGREIVNRYKPCVVAVNKMDLAPETTLEEWESYVRDSLPGLAFAPVVYISALTGDSVMRLIQTAQALHEQSFIRVSTGRLNRAMEEMTARVRPPSTSSKQARIYYATQVDTQPPTIALFMNHPELLNDAYTRYLANQLRERFGFTSIPIKFIPRSRGAPRQEG